MPAIAPPPPKAPSPAPVSPPAKPAGGSIPSAPGRFDHEPSPENYLGDIGDELVALDEADNTAKRAPEKPRDPVTKKFVKADEKTTKPQDEPKEDKPAETPTEPEKPVEEPKPSNVRQLGKAYDALKKERDEVYQPKIQSLEAKTKEYEHTIEELRKSTPDLKPLQEEITNLKKERQQLLEVVRYADYKKSPEFTEKYEKPYNEAWSKAVGEVTQLSLTLEDGTVRKATANDLLAIANAPLDQLDDLAQSWFRKSAPRVVRHVEKIRDLAEAQDKALKEAEKGAGDFQANRLKSVQEANQNFTNAYTSVTNELPKKWPKLFAPDEADPKGNEILKKGFEFADTVFSQNGNQLPPEKKAARLAVVRAKAANHDRLVLKVNTLRAEMAELKAKLDEYEKSEPPTDVDGNPTSGTDVYGVSDYEAELRKLDK